MAYIRPIHQILVLAVMVPTLTSCQREPAPGTATSREAGASASAPTDGRSADTLARRVVERRAVEAAIWGMPIVSTDAMRRAFFENGGKYGDIAYLSKPADWKFLVTTPNASTHYVNLYYNLKDGPWVLEIPAAVGAGIFGSINDAWQVPIVDVGPEGEDKGKGGKYLLVPPGYDGAISKGYIPARSATYNGYSFLRASSKSSSAEDVAKAIALVKQLRLYPLAHAANPPASNHIDVAGKLYDGIVRMDDTFYDSLAKMVNEEPVQTRDLVTMGQLKSIGSEKGKDFKPDAATRTVLREAIAEAKAQLVASALNNTTYWNDASWGTAAFFQTGAETGFTFETENGLDVDGRGGMFFAACAPPKKLGAASIYLATSDDATGASLDGGQRYRLHVPPNVPARQFWAVTVYSVDEAAFIRESPKTEVNSYQELQKNADGSIDIDFGPDAPAGKESNWVYTARGKPWMAFFRFYGQEPAIRDKSWKLPNIQRAN